VALAAGRLGDWRWDAASDRLTLGERAAAIFGLPAETPLAWNELRARLDPNRPRSRAARDAAGLCRPERPELECRLLADGGRSALGRPWSAAPTTPSRPAAKACWA
jgi:PAS domain-containing protein